jgi:hypothetical protein
MQYMRPAQAFPRGLERSDFVPWLFITPLDRRDLGSCGHVGDWLSLTRLTRLRHWLCTAPIVSVQSKYSVSADANAVV